MIDMKEVIALDEREKALDIRARSIRAIGSNKLMADDHPGDPWWEGYAAACQDNQAAVLRVNLESGE